MEMNAEINKNIMKKIYNATIYLAHDNNREKICKEMMLTMYKLIKILLCTTLLAVLWSPFDALAELVVTRTAEHMVHVGANPAGTSMMINVRRGTLFSTLYAGVRSDTHGDHNAPSWDITPMTTGGLNFVFGSGENPPWDVNQIGFTLLITGPPFGELGTEIALSGMELGTDVLVPVTVQAGDNLNVTMWRLGPGTGQLRLAINGSIVYDDIYTSFPVGYRNISVGLRINYTTYTLYPPLFETPLDLEAHVGDVLDVYAGLFGRWGYSTSRTIPNLGSILLAPESMAILPEITTDNLTYTSIGSFPLSYEMRDDHSLSAEPQYMIDDTVTTRVRSIIIRTLTLPTLLITYGHNTKGPDGYTDISDIPYDPTTPGLLPCGGEEGWTNRRLDIISSAGTITGKFAIHNIMTGNPTIRSFFDTAERINHNLESTTTSGTSVYAEITDTTDFNLQLAPVTTGLVKIDVTPPVGALSHGGNWDFTDLSTDALSQLSVTRPTKMAFSDDLSSLIPPTFGWEEVGSHSMNATGVFDVWVWATDKAGNEHIVKALSAMPFTAREVTISKDTDRGATLHTHDCPFATLPVLDASCSSCTVGAKDRKSTRLNSSHT